MSSSASRLEPRTLEDALQGTRFAGRLLLLDSVSSTIDECRRAADGAAPEAFAVLAEEQRGGRGQRGHGWLSPRGLSLSLSALLRPDLPPARASELVGLAGLAVVDALEAAGVEGLVAKRPNDLLLPDPRGGLRKIGGVLVETAVQGSELRHAIVSVGLNVLQREEDFPAALRPWAGSLLGLTGRRHDRATLAAALLRSLDRTAGVLAAGRQAADLERWRRRSVELEDFRPPDWPVEEDP